jgi:hypothetical protein
MKVHDRFPEGKMRGFDRLNHDQAAGPIWFSTIGKSTSLVQNRASFSSTADKAGYAIFAPGDKCDPSVTLRLREDPLAETALGRLERHSMPCDTPPREAKNRCAPRRHVDRHADAPDHHDKSCCRKPVGKHCHLLEDTALDLTGRHYGSGHDFNQQLSGQRYLDVTSF